MTYRIDHQSLYGFNWYAFIYGGKMRKSRLSIIFFLILFCYGLENSHAKETFKEKKELGKITSSIHLKLQALKKILAFESPLKRNQEKNDGIDDILSIEPFIFPTNFQIIDSKDKSFMMGSFKNEIGRDVDEAGEDGRPVKVTFSYSFKIMTSELTQKQWVDVMGENPSYFKKKKYCNDSHQEMQTDKKNVILCPNHPVENVSWNEVQHFIEILNKRQGLKRCHGAIKNRVGCYRLPTEAEWEYAARGGTHTAYFFGDNPTSLDRYAWYLKDWDEQTHPIGLKDANAFGLYDIHGNVWEWVQDAYKIYLPGGRDPLEKSNFIRVFRGGSWNEEAVFLRSAYRFFGYAQRKYLDVGFRLARTL